MYKVGQNLIDRSECTLLGLLAVVGVDRELNVTEDADADAVAAGSPAEFWYDTATV